MHVRKENCTVLPRRTTSYSSPLRSYSASATANNASHTAPPSLRSSTRFRYGSASSPFRFDVRHSDVIRTSFALSATGSETVATGRLASACTRREILVKLYHLRSPSRRSSSRRPQSTNARRRIGNSSVVAASCRLPERVQSCRNRIAI